MWRQDGECHVQLQVLHLFTLLLARFHVAASQRSEAHQGMKAFNYQCVRCGEVESNETLQSFICECGGEYKLQEKILMDIFEPYYDETLKMRIHSAAQRNREFRKAGMYVSQDDKKMMKRWSDFRKYKEEIHQETMAREGITYRPGSNKEWDAQKQDFVPRGGYRRERIYSFGR